MFTKARLRGIVGGAAILTLFGGFWCIMALAFWAARPAWAIPAAIATALVLLIFCIFRWTATAKMAHAHDSAAAAKGKRAGILFGIIFGIEGALCGLSSALLGSSGHGDWIPLAIAIIVALHFLPLAHIFEAVLYYWTGALALLGVLGCLFIHPAGLRFLSVGLVMAGVLWGTAFLLLVQTRSAPV